MTSAAPAADDAASLDDGRADFGFCIGRWTCRHRRLRMPLLGSGDWHEFPGATVARRILGGIGNIGVNGFPTFSKRPNTAGALPPRPDSVMARLGLGMTNESAGRNSSLRRANFLAVFRLQGDASSFLVRVRQRLLFGALRQAALWCRDVGDDVEIVGGGLHGGSSFC